MKSPVGEVAASTLTDGPLTEPFLWGTIGRRVSPRQIPLDKMIFVRYNADIAQAAEGGASAA